MGRRLPPQLTAQLVALGQRYGIDQLGLDDDGEVVLGFEDGIEVGLACSGPLSDLRLFCDVGALPARPEPGLLLELLQLNRVGADPEEAVIGLTDDDPPRMLAAQRMDWRGLTVTDFVATAEAFVDLAEDLHALCRESANAAPGPLPGTMTLRG